MWLDGHMHHDVVRVPVITSKRAASLNQDQTSPHIITASSCIIVFRTATKTTNLEMCNGKSAIIIMKQPIQNIPADADACAAAMQQQQQQQHQRMEESNGNATTARTGRRRRRRQQVTPITTTATSSDDNTAGRQLLQQPTLEPSLSMLENGRALIGDDMGAETITPIERNNHLDATPSDDTLPSPDHLRIHRATARVLNQEEIAISGNNNTKPGAFPERGRPVGLHRNQIQNNARPQHQNQRGRNRTDQEDQIQLLGLSDRLSSRAFASLVRTQQDVPVATAVLIHRPSLRRQNEYRDGLRCSSIISSSGGGRTSSLPPPTLHRHSSDPTNMSSTVEVSTTALDRPALLRQDKARGLRCSGVSSNASHTEGARTYHRRHSSDPTALLLLDASVRLASMTSTTTTQQEDLSFNAIPPELRPTAAAAAAAAREARLPSLIPENNVQKLDSNRPNNNTGLERFFERITHHHHQGTNNKGVPRRK